MNINVKCFSKLSNPADCSYDQPHSVSISGDQATVRNLLPAVHLSEADIATVFVNGRRSELNQTLNDGDQVAFVPPVGGM